MVIENGSENKFVLLAGSANPKLSKKIANILETKIYSCASQFPDGETKTEIPVSVRDKHVFIIQSISPPNHDRYLMELLQMAWTAKTCSAEQVTAVIPYMGYARADRMNRGRIPMTIDIIKSTLITCGVDSFITIDLHAEQSRGGDRPRRWDILYGSSVLVPAIKRFDNQNTAIVAPDGGAEGRSRWYNSLLEINSDIVLCHKRRDPKTLKTEVTGVSGNIEGKDAWIIDDVIASFGSMEEVIKHLSKDGVRSINAAATHGVLCGEALNNIDRSPVEKVFITDTIKQPDDLLTKHPKIKVISVAPLLAEAISRRVEKSKSMSELFSMQFDQEV